MQRMSKIRAFIITGAATMEIDKKTNIIKKIIFNKHLEKHRILLQTFRKRNKQSKSLNKEKLSLLFT